MSAAESSAGWNRSGWAALTSSQERASSGSMRWPGTGWNAGEGVIAAGRVTVMRGSFTGLGRRAEVAGGVPRAADGRGTDQVGPERAASVRRRRAPRVCGASTAQYTPLCLTSPW